MTFSNGGYNPNPLGNAFNTRLGPANYSLNPNGQSHSKGFSSDNKSLPDPVMLNDPNGPQNELHVPHGNEPPFTLAQLQGIVDDYANGKQWDDREIHRLDSTGVQIDRKSAAYWERVNAENNKALSSMTDEQKKMLDDINSIFPISRLELED